MTANCFLICSIPQLQCLVRPEKKFYLTTLAVQCFVIGFFSSFALACFFKNDIFGFMTDCGLGALGISSISVFLFKSTLKNKVTFLDLSKKSGGRYIAVKIAKEFILVIVTDTPKIHLLSRLNYFRLKKLAENVSFENRKMLLEKVSTIFNKGISGYVCLIQLPEKFLSFRTFDTAKIVAKRQSEFVDGKEKVFYEIIHHKNLPKNTERLNIIENQGDLALNQDVEAIKLALEPSSCLLKVELS